MSKPGPRPGHTHEEIAAAAITLADADGLAAVSMRRVAADIGLSPMSLYNYVKDKKALHALMIDAALGELPELAPGDDWREDVCELALRLRAVMLRHPWLPALSTSRVFITPNVLRQVECMLRLLGPAELPAHTAFETVVTINGLVASQVSTEINPGWAELDDDVRQALSEGLATGRYPLAAAAVMAIDPAESAETRFRRTLTRLLTGLA